ncbi:MAG: hypothetical protein C0183_00880 [Roseiflexus castenholzii]|nr:MAG: hypothetical protein C0183_00880 [Roseiflexus castenholzii]
MSFDLHRLRIFATVARAGSFTRAAEQLHMAQPTVSQQISALEDAVGASLIERSPRRLRLTPAGEALLPYANRLALRRCRRHARRPALRRTRSAWGSGRRWQRTCCRRFCVATVNARHTTTLGL